MMDVIVILSMINSEYQIQYIDEQNPLEPESNGYPANPPQPKQNRKTLYYQLI